MKRTIIILAKAGTGNKDDMEFYNLMLRQDRDLTKIALVVLLPSVEQFALYLETLSPQANFSLLIHLGNFSMNPPQDGNDLYEDLMKLPFFGKLKFEYTSRQGENTHNGARVLHSQKLIKNLYDIESIPLNNKADLFNITETEPKKDRVDFVIQTALYEDEFAVYETDCKLEPYPSVYNSYKASFKENKKTLAAGDYNKEFLLVHQMQMGLVDAAIHATQVITKADPTFLLMSGVCGGREYEVNLYDVIIPSIVYDYATGKIKENKLESLEYKASANKKLIQFLKDNSDKIIHNMRSIINPDRKKLLGKDFKIVIDEFACGPWVIKTEGFMRKMKGEKLEKFTAKKENDLFLESIPVTKISKGIKGLEMESYSLLRTAEVIQKEGRFTIVAKSVMDFTNEYKKDGPNGEVKSSAAYVSYLCVRAMMPILLEFKSKLDTWTE